MFGDRQHGSKGYIESIVVYNYSINIHYNDSEESL